MPRRGVLHSIRDHSLLRADESMSRDVIRIQLLGSYEAYRKT